MKPLRRMPAGRRLHTAGFTLVEVLVALFIMALLATLAWQGLDGILRARDASTTSMDRTVRLSTVLTQWEQDLQAVFDTAAVPAISFDGQTVRLTRRAEGGVRLVTWAVRGGLWQRWAGPVVVLVPDLQDSWLRSQQFVGNEPGQLLLASGASDWQVYFSRGGQWTNAQSTGDLALPAPPPPPPASGASGPLAAPPVQRELLPDGVRLQITLDGQTLTRDITLGPAGN